MKNSVVSLVLVGAAAQVFAANPPAATDRLVACMDVQESTARLACFDREIVSIARPRVAATTPAVPPARPAPVPTLPSPAPAPAPAPTTAAPRPAPAPAAATLGEEQLSSSRRPQTQEDAPSLSARISDLREVGSGAYLVVLDNGQSWRHVDQHLGSYLREGESVTIRKATLGSYRLTRDGGNSKDWIRVTRVR